MISKNKYITKRASRKINKGDILYNNMPFNAESMYSLWVNNPNYRKKYKSNDAGWYDPKNPNTYYAYPRHMFGSRGLMTDLQREENESELDKKIPMPFIANPDTSRKEYYDWVNNETNRPGIRIKPYRDDWIKPRKGLPQLREDEKDAINAWHNYRYRLTDKDNPYSWRSGGRYIAPDHPTEREDNLNNFAYPQTLTNASLTASLNANPLPKNLRKPNQNMQFAQSNSEITQIPYLNSLPKRNSKLYMGYESESNNKQLFENPTDYVTYNNYGFLNNPDNVMVNQDYESLSGVYGRTGAKNRYERLKPPPAPKITGIGSYGGPAELTSSSTYQNLFNNKNWNNPNPTQKTMLDYVKQQLGIQTNDSYVDNMLGNQIKLLLEKFKKSKNKWITENYPLF